MAPQAESHWRTDFKALVPAPNSTEIVMLKSHMERGLSMPPSSFFMNLLKFYGLQLHHIAPNSLVSMAGYAALCEGFLGIHPRTSSSFTSLCGPITRTTDFFGPVEQYAFFHEGLKNIPLSPLWIPP
jgi:hypothetical protein